MNRYGENAMETFFYPKNIAVVGVVDSAANMGINIIRNLNKFRYEGTVFAVGRKGGRVDDRPIYKSVLDIPEEVELATFLVPSRYIPELADECGRKGIKHIVICSAGFSEVGPQNAELDEQLRDVCHRYGIRVVGPNCVGLKNTDNGLCLPFVEEVDSLWKPGPLGIIAQSGTVALDSARRACAENIGFSKMASIGNKFDLDEVDYLKYLLDDAKTEIIFIYLEGFSRFREFITLAGSAKKPIILHKSNTSPLSSTIAQSHTKGLTCDDSVVEALCKQAGIIRVRNMDEVFDCVKVLLLPQLKGNRLAVMSPGGGVCVQLADECFQNGFSFPDLPADIKEWLKDQGRAKVIDPNNPIDLGDIYDRRATMGLIERLLESDTYDGIYYDEGCTPMPYYIDHRYHDFLRFINTVNEGAAKPVYIRIPTFDYADLSDVIGPLQIPHFQSQAGSLQAIRKMMMARRERRISSPASQKGIPDSGKIRSILRQHMEKERQFIDHEGFSILSDVGISTPWHTYVPKERCQSMDERSFPYPVAVKAVGEDLLHKTEAGAVALDIKNGSELKTTLSAMIADPRTASAEGFMIQQMVSSGVEMIVGAKQDPQFGPIVLVGLGGTMVEMFSDISTGLAPVDFKLAGKMVEDLKCFPLLNGYRGKAVADIDALCDIVERVGNLVATFPEIAEIDLNPVKVMEKGQGAIAVDCRIVFQHD
jgi:acyl-CoA synthetase (NDP forming)